MALAVPGRQGQHDWDRLQLGLSFTSGLLAGGCLDWSTYDPVVHLSQDPNCVLLTASSGLQNTQYPPVTQLGGSATVCAAQSQTILNIDASFTSLRTEN